MNAAQAVLDELSIHGLRTVVEHLGALSPELQVEAGRRILAQKSASNADMEFVRQHVPTLTNETAASTRPAYEDVIAKVRAALVKV